MFIRRCGWHRRYYGHGKLLGVTSWLSLTLTFSDGMCDRCAVRAREEWDLPRVAAENSPELSPRTRSPFPFVTATVAASIAVVVFGFVTGRSDDASVTRGAAIDITRARVGASASPVPPVPERYSVVARAEAGAVPRDTAPQSPEITGARATSLVPVRPVVRRARFAVVRHRPDVILASEPHDEVHASAAPPETAPVVVAVASAMVVPVSPIDARSLHPFSAPGIVQMQAP